jgi:transcriptional regulator with XRE-family HTH domain
MAHDVRNCQRCGALLSRYNRDVRCAACVAAEPIPEIPPALWQLGPIRDALASDDLGAVLVTARQALCFSQAELADLLSDNELTFSQPKVSRIEAGTPVREIDDRRRISDVLGIPAELLGLASRHSFTAASLALRPVATVVVREATAAMQRRTVLTGAAALVGWTLGGPLAEPSHQRIGTAHVQQSEDTLAQLWALDDRYGSDGIQELAVGLLQRLHAMLNHGTYDEPTGLRLQTMAGRVAEHAGWLSYDAGRQDHARYYLAEALTAARLSGDEELEVLVLGSLSVQAAHVGRHREAIALASRAQDTRVAHRMPAAYAMAAFREARAHALAQDDANANKAMLRAEKAFARASNRPDWIAYLDDAELAAKFAFCWAALGHSSKAIGLFSQALDGQHDAYQRNRALYSAYLAHAHLANSDVDQAATVGVAALDRVEQVTSVRALDEAASLRRRLAPHRSVPLARQYIEQFDDRFPHRAPPAGGNGG